MRSLLMTLALTLLSFPTLSHAASMRCGTHLISDGSSKVEVLAKCGEPTAKESRTETIEVRNRDRRGGGSTTTTTQKNIEEWTYNFGPTRLMQVVTFENGVLTDVKSTTHGF
ncbi:MAG TPA: DUF2845 domain-containing protein [Myxococcaceae bacterium]|jgi:hypothetical protein